MSHEPGSCHPIAPDIDAPIPVCQEAHDYLTPPPEYVACGGCATETPGCCYQLVGLSLYEVGFIVATYPTLIAERLGAIARDALLQLEHPTAWGGMKAAIEGDATEAGRQIELGSEWWWELKKPCVFLTPLGKCGVYHARPDACAGHWLHASCSRDVCAPGTARGGTYIDTGPRIIDLAIKRAKQGMILEHDEGRTEIPKGACSGIAMGVIVVMVLMSREATEAGLRAAAPEICDRLLSLADKWIARDPS